MPPKLLKTVLTLVVVVLMVGVSFVQRELVRERDELGISRYTELKGAPPVLQLTTVALGGFRGLISNILWMRASDLQENDKFFEMVQLADWITKLEPHFTQVWLVQSWNMAYNISVKFKDPEDRWRWVQRGIELLRDQGLVYNPDDVLMYRELAWFFQHKMGQNLDDANMYYKQMWLKEMSTVLGMDKPDWDALIHPKTEDEKKRATLLREKYKMDPVFMKEVDDRYGPLEWRLPETSAIYWAALGLRAAKNDQQRIDPNDLITLRRVIYQSMQLAFQRGRLIVDNADRQFDFGPNLSNIPNANNVYLEAMTDDEKNRDHIATAHRNFLRDAVFLLYTYNRQADAQTWFNYMATNYPDKPLLDGKPNTLPKNMDLDSYAMGRIQEELNDPGRDKAEGLIEGFERQAYESLAVGDDDRYIGMDSLAKKLWNFYESKVGVNEASRERVGLKSVAEIKQRVLDRLLDGEMSPQLTAQLRTRLGLPAATAPGSSTNSIPSLPVSTNTPPATNAVAQ
jgi:hypothetical protein